jgi:IS4 transposase
VALREGWGHAARMFLEAVFDRFVRKSPVTVMTRALLENALAPSSLNALFGEHSEWQYEHKLLFSSVVDLMGMVVCRIQPSIHTAYKDVKDTLPVSLAAVYDKVNGIEPEVTAALVRHTATKLAPVIEAMGGQLPPLLPGYRARIIDGNHLAATERRLAVLRRSKAGPLPGHALVLLDPALMLALDMIPCEDGHAQERSLFSDVLARVAPQDLWIADRNFCTVGFLQGVVERKGSFVIRQHGSLPIASSGTLHHRGRCSTGTVFEQSVTILGNGGQSIMLRRIVVHPDEPTREGETEIAILTNVPGRHATAGRVADIYRERWTVEGLFQTLTQILSGEIPSLGYPKAALFAFGVALVSYNIASVIRAALRAKFGHAQVEDEVSWYYVANEVRVVSGGMDVALDDDVWVRFRSMPPQELASTLLDCASHVRLDKFKRTKRGPKKPVPPRTKHAGTPHVSTARLLARAGHKV